MHERGRNKLMAMVTTLVNGLSAIEDLLPAVQGRRTVGAHGVRLLFRYRLRQPFSQTTIHARIPLASRLMLCDRLDEF